MLSRPEPSSTLSTPYLPSHQQSLPSMYGEPLLNSYQPSLVTSESVGQGLAFEPFPENPSYPCNDFLPSTDAVYNPHTMTDVQTTGSLVPSPPPTFTPNLNLTADQLCMSNTHPPEPIPEPAPSFASFLTQLCNDGNLPEVLSYNPQTDNSQVEILYSSPKISGSYLHVHH